MPLSYFQIQRPHMKAGNNDCFMKKYKDISSFCNTFHTKKEIMHSIKSYLLMTLSGILSDQTYKKMTAVK